MSLPPEFIHRMQCLLGPAEADALCHALSQSPASVSIRQNPAKPCILFADDTAQATQTETAEHPQKTTAEQPSTKDNSPKTAPPKLQRATAVPWCSAGSYLRQRPAFTFDPRLHAGAYYVQEAASMFVAQAYARIAQELQPQRLLDLCAAPGGKSTLWRSLLPDEALLVANEPIRTRAQILAENLSKWGHPAVVCTNAYPADFAPFHSAFDVIAADVPCSGEGMFRKDEQARAEWSPAAVDHCAQRQRDILRDVWPALRQGGFLVYSTCTFNREENEDNLRWICETLGAELIPIPHPESWNIASDATQSGLSVCRFFPHRCAGEGLFLALLRKTAPAPAPQSPTPKPKSKPRKGAGKHPADTTLSKAQESQLRRWICPNEAYTLFSQGENTFGALPQRHHDFALALHHSLPCLLTGLTLAELKGNKLIPQAQLALSTALAPDAFVRVALSYEQAIAYLRREAISLPTDTPRGYVLLCYEGLPIGFANHLGTRANNLYPEHWRIRSQGR